MLADRSRTDFFVAPQEISLRGRGGEHARRMFESGRGHDALGLFGPACAHPPGVSSELPGFHARRGWQPRLSIANGTDGWHDNRNRVHSMFVEHNPCGVGMVEDQYGNCVPAPGGGGGPTGPGCMFNCGGGSGGCIANPNAPGCGGSPPCLNSCLSYVGNPKDGQHCDGSQFAIGESLVPTTENSSGTTYYINNITNVWENNVIVAVIYQTSTPVTGSVVVAQDGKARYIKSIAELVDRAGNVVGWV